MGSGLRACFGGPFTRRGCCYSRWFRQSDPAIVAMQRVAAEDSGFFFGYQLAVERGTYYAHLFDVLNVTGPCVEVGVKRGEFSSDFLRKVFALRPSLGPPRYFMVDVWRRVPAKEHYVDVANVDNAAHRDSLKAAVDRAAEFWQTLSVVQLRSREAVRLFKDEELAFVYLDARHDYCAVYEELTLYWPKVRAGGVLAGDDCYMSVSTTYGDWQVCEDGTRRAGGPCQAVRDFTLERRLRWRKLQHQFIIFKPVVITATSSI